MDPDTSPAPEIDNRLTPAYQLLQQAAIATNLLPSEVTAAANRHSETTPQLSDLDLMRQGHYPVAVAQSLANRLSAEIASAEAPVSKLMDLMDAAYLTPVRVGDKLVRICHLWDRESGGWVDVVPRLPVKWLTLLRAGPTPFRHVFAVKA